MQEDWEAHFVASPASTFPTSSSVICCPVAEIEGRGADLVQIQYLCHDGYLGDASHAVEDPSFAER